MTSIFSLSQIGNYPFAKSHASSFAVLVYQSAWFRHYHPLSFFVALLNNQPMGFWQPSVTITDAQPHGIKVLSVDNKQSDAMCTIEDGCLRIGLQYVKGVRGKASNRILGARKQEDFCQRTRLLQ